MQTNYPLSTLTGRALLLQLPGAARREQSAEARKIDPTLRAACAGVARAQRFENTAWLILGASALGVIILSFWL